MAESFNDQLGRARLMASSPGEWDFTENDVAALRAVMAHYDRMRQAIADEIHQLEAWVNESRNGGWSTHQVDAQRRRADQLRRLLLP